MNSLFRSWFFPLVPQVLGLIAFGLLIVGGLAADTGNPAFAKVLSNTNLANLIVWSYWWPLIILGAIVFGRVWCMICPMELVTSTASRIGLKRRPPKWVRSGWGITVFYVMILFVGIHTLAAHRIPFRMALYMLTLLCVAVIVGLVFSRNTFCASVCPVGHLLGLYARLAPFGWGVKDKSVCQGCKDKSCISPRTAYRFQGHSCAVSLVPNKIKNNDACLLCGQCLKACDQNNPGLDERPNPGLFKKPFAQDLFSLQGLSGAQASFCLVVSGFVIYEILTEWGVTKDLLLYTPNLIQLQLGWSNVWAAGLIQSMLLFVILPLFLWLIPYGLFRVQSRAMSVKEYLCTFGIAFIPIMAATHALKSLLKMTSRIPYWRNALTDPVGINTARDILEKKLHLAQLPTWSDVLLTLAALDLVLVGIFLSALTVRRLSVRLAGTTRAQSIIFYLIPTLYGGVFLVTLVAWRVF
ncbi:MAG: 4Fe-4S binding protein [Deltaproteobacteria bacterium]|nr:4Fe-4S binding protein [Deltaproteobacteria bacterium]